MKLAGGNLNAAGITELCWYRYKLAAYVLYFVL